MRSLSSILATVAFVFVIALVAASCGDDTEPVSAGDPDPTSVADDDNGVGDVDQPAPGDDDAPLGAGPYPIADLTIDYSHAGQGVSYSYQIVCLGDTATLIGDAPGVADQSACLALADAAVQQRLIDGPPADQVCTEQYGGDDVARITGRIDDVAVDTTVDRANGCGIADWDQLLAGILPNPLGA